MGERGVTRRHGDAGAAAVEFALVAPILLMLVFGVMQYGIFFMEQARAAGGLGRAAETASFGELSTTALETAALGGAEAEWVESVSVCYRDADATGEGVGVYSRRDELELTLRWRPTSLEIPIVPFLGSEPRQERVTTSVRQVGRMVPVVCGT